MLGILRYGLIDNGKSLWLLGYGLLFFAISGGLVYFTGSSAKSVLTLLNVVLLVVPAVSILFATVFFYNTASFREILLSQPIDRKSVYLGFYGGFTIPLSCALLVGLTASLPFYPEGSEFTQLGIIAATAILLTVIFSAIGFFISACSNDRMRGFTTAVLCWLYFALVHDGLILFLVSAFSDFRVEYLAAVLCLLDPVTLSRVLVMLNLDVSALMGCSGALIRQLMGAATGCGFVAATLVLWATLPIAAGAHIFHRRDL